MSTPPAKSPPRAMGIDLGEARIGIALSDDLGLFAHPRETIRVPPTKSRASEKVVLDKVVELVHTAKVGVIALGLPRNMDGSEGPAAAKARAFAELLRTQTGCEVKMIDERLTTVAAQKALHASGRNVKRGRAVIDQVAAQMILQTYLDTEALRRENAMAEPG